MTRTTRRHGGRAFSRISIALCAGLCAAATPAAAWGPEGHTVTARVATAKLRGRAARDLKWIIAVGVPALNAQMQQHYGVKCQIDPTDPWGPVPDYTIDHDVHTNLANWPDCYRTLDATTAGWHFNDIPLGQLPGGPLAPTTQAWCAEPVSCASAALAANLRVLSTAGTDPADAARALAFVVHLVGDMHQPLHEEDDGDRGGNDVLIIPSADSGVDATRLHALWDTPLVAIALGPDLATATSTLQSQIAGRPAARFRTVAALILATDRWAEEAHGLAQPAYALLDIAAGTGATSAVPVTKAYVQAEATVVASQLNLAAIRLRGALNTTLTWKPPA